MENFLLLYVVLALLNIPIMIITTDKVYKAKNRERDFVRVALIIILSAVFPLTWFSAVVLILISE